MKKVIAILLCTIFIVFSLIVVAKAKLLKPSKDFSLTNMYVTFPNDKEIEIYNSLDDGKTLLTKMIKEPWGTWNIGSWSLSESTKVPASNPVLMAGGGTDWEYVFRAGETRGAGASFSGGAHGKEQLRGIKLYNADDGSEIELKEGNKAHVKTLKIVENTTIALDDKFKNKYADVQRTYLISPSKITLECDFKFLKDIYMGTSYVCMLPMEKDYGRYIRFSESENQYSTPKTGETKTKPGFPDYLGKEKSMSVSIWGDANPNYIFKTWIGSAEMTDNFSNELKAFYWDCDKKMNKLYFSKYDEDGERLVSAGTVWHTKQGWELDVKNNG